MSAENDEEKSRCANCGASEGKDTKLKTCTGCKSVKYCSVICQKEHRPKHKGACRARAAELKDEILFKQPEQNHLGDCPICFLPLPLDMKTSILTHCCGKILCHGCCIANQKREAVEKLVKKCPFCRTPAPKSIAEDHEIAKERARKGNDPMVLSQIGIRYNKAGNCQRALELLTKAADLGDAPAHYEIAGMYVLGYGVEKNESKQLHHYEQATILGHADARYDLGVMEWNKGRHERAIKHWTIAANFGQNFSLERLKMAYQIELISKDDFAAALRAHKAAIDATKSPHREEAARLKAAGGDKQWRLRR